MKAKIFILIVSVLTFTDIHSQPEKFIKALINGDNIESFIDKDELKRSRKLEITYTNVYKPLISYDIESQIKEKIRNDKLSYNTEIVNSDGEYTILKFITKVPDYTKIYYFRNGKFIYPSTYFTKDWQTYESRYFKIRVSEPEYFNAQCKMLLDMHVESIGSLLNIPMDERNELADKKILYTFCKNEEEIEKITGYKAKGIYLTANDEIVTTYATHYHELSHLMMNYKLKNLELYTHPFLLEGFATSTGGRGGLGNEVLNDMGWFLINSGFVNYKEILSSEGFYNEDASISYSTAGFFNSFLINHLGAEKYIELYRKANGDAEHAKNYELEIISENEFKNYTDNYEKYRAVQFDTATGSNENPELQNKYFTWEIKDKRVYFYTSVPVLKLYLNDLKIIGYKSRLFEELTGETYKGEAYLILADTDHIKVYSCLNDELIASYERGFDVIQRKVPFITSNDKAYYKFNIREDVFDSALSRNE